MERKAIIIRNSKNNTRCIAVDEANASKLLDFFRHDARHVKKKGQENSRVYCREVTMKDKTFVVIASELLVRKKQNKLTHKEINIIHRVAAYEYTEIK